MEDSISSTRGQAPRTGSAAPTSQRSRILTAIGLGVLPLVLLAAANLWRQVQQGEEGVTESRVAVARAAALTVAGFVDTSFATLRSLAGTRTITDPTSRPELTELLNNARATDPSLAVVGLFRSDGWNVALAGLDQPPLTLNVLDRQYVEEARSTGQPVVSPATIPRTTGILTVDLVIPIDFTTGGRGVLSGSLALTKLGEQLRGLPGSDTVQIVLVDANGQVILHPDPNVVRAVTSLRGRPEVDSVLLGRTGTLRTTSVDGSEDLIAYAPVPGYGWGVLVQQPTATAFALVRRDLLLATALLASILVLVGLMGWLLGGRLQLAYTQLVQAKTHAEGAQAQAEAAQRRLAFLAEASRILGSSLQDNTALQQVAQLALPTLGDECVLDLVGPDGRGTTREAAAAAVAISRQHQALEPTINRLSTEAVATAHVVKFENRDHAKLAGIAVPLLASGRVVGAFTCVREDQPDYDDADLSLAMELAHRVALAVDNRELYEAAQHAIHARDEFLSVAAHELKTPITSLRGYAQLALRRLDVRETRTAEQVRKALEIIEHQSGKLTRLVAQLLDVSRLEAGKLTLTREPVDLVPAVHALAERARLLSENHQVIVEAPPTAIVSVDLLRIEQVLTNLVDNAIKYSPHGGRVYVRVSRADGDAVVLSVQDEGVGIPPERRPHIFERFYQAHSETLPSMTGMGLGLYISRQIVELHGGTIRAEFPDEGGVRVLMELPCNAEASALAHGRADPDPH